VKYIPNNERWMLQALDEKYYAIRFDRIKQTLFIAMFVKSWRLYSREDLWEAFQIPYKDIYTEYLEHKLSPGRNGRLTFLFSNYNRVQIAKGLQALLTLDWIVNKVSTFNRFSR